MAVSREQLVDLIKEMPAIELAKLVKDLEDALGVSASMPVAAAPVAAAAEAAGAAVEEKSEFKIVLKDVGSEKIKVIKALRQVVSGLSLADAKKITESAPAPVSDGSYPKEEAQKIKKELEGAGATVELQ